MINYLKNIYHYVLAWAGSILYWFPSREIFVLGVTGTKGKSTTVELINAILEAAGKKTALVSSLRFKIGSQSIKNDTSMTMPGRFFIQKKLREAVNAGCEYFLIEVTSQGILQHRHRFIDFDAALFTNVHPEHIEAHGSFENYRQTKASFFEYVAHKSKKPQKFFLMNEDDPSKSYFVHAVNGSGKVFYFGREHFIDKDLDKMKIADWFLNNFNLENAAAATAFAKARNIDWQAITKVLSKFGGIPGRLEVLKEKPFKVVIDYAHTPDSLEKVYEALSASVRSSKFKVQKLICVLGAAGGGRDKWKRPVMGKIAAHYCKDIILTNEDPYDEKPTSILDQIESGFSENQKSRQGRGSPEAAKIKNQNFNYWKILDRKEAIKKAISLAKAGDTVIITGKGSESWLHMAGGKKIAWDEKRVVEEILRK
ncbi:MAG: hypothetical protein A3J53_01795 [Candidatus Harrisonbacteria bacterium RIFCSPHIGHO2_02_FULL_40_20]|nr:MAG: hypothetical protein A3J53_01795 [Candidatus Harrisonbacteria bacterium RIFCSPHIGHO2_02_FULL_40_20]